MSIIDAPVVVRGVPLAARTLIWDVFFTSRQRGVDLSTHFPWIEQSADTHCVKLSVSDGGPVVATLVLRQPHFATVGRYAMVGMVCVDRAWRGRGFASQLLTSAVAFSIEQQFAALLLWTGQAGVYKSHGFVLDACDSFGRVTSNPLRPRAKVEFTRVHPDASRGLPPFAQKLISVESAVARIVVVESAQCLALAEWEGSLPAVLDLIEATLPTSWGINAPIADPIFEEIQRRGHKYTSLLCAERMVLHLAAPVPLPYISVLDRI